MLAYPVREGYKYQGRQNPRKNYDEAEAQLGKPDDSHTMNRRRNSGARSGRMTQIQSNLLGYTPMMRLSNCGAESEPWMIGVLQKGMKRK